MDTSLLAILFFTFSLRPVEENVLASSGKEDETKLAAEASTWADVVKSGHKSSSPASENVSDKYRPLQNLKNRK